MQCLTIALTNPPKEGEYRVFNQFEEVYDITELAYKVQKSASSLGMDVAIRNLDNPRFEQEQHFYEPDHQHLFDLGYKPTHDVETEIKIMLTDLIKYRKRIDVRSEALVPDIRWDGTRKRSKFI